MSRVRICPADVTVADGERWPVCLFVGDDDRYAAVYAWRDGQAVLLVAGEGEPLVDGSWVLDDGRRLIVRLAVVCRCYVPPQLRMFEPATLVGVNA